MAEARRFAIGDIHGCIKTFRAMLFKKLMIRKEDYIYLVGDYIDRGPDSKAVLDLMMYLIDNGYNLLPVRGNHEEMFLDYFDDKQSSWMYNGADATLKSFRQGGPAHIDEKYKEFVKSMPYYYETEGFIITHAGINSHEDDPLNDTYSMLWTRDDYVNPRKTNYRKVVAGHTPHNLKVIRASLNEMKIQLDGGCVYAGRIGDYGNLCAINLDTMELFVQMNIEHYPEEL